MRRGDLVSCPKSQKSNDFYKRKKRTHYLEAILMMRSKYPGSWRWGNEMPLLGGYNVFRASQAPAIARMW